jgi:hypothetical protein
MNVVTPVRFHHALWPVADPSCGFGGSCGRT